MSFPSLDKFFTQGDFVGDFQKPCHRNTPEVADPIWLDVQGEIPTWLQGVLYRIGPGKFILGEEGGRSLTITHAFDGLAYIHRFEFDGNSQKIRYNSRHTAKAFEKQLLENPFGGYTSYGTVYAVGSAWQRFMDFLARVNKKPHPDPSSGPVNVTITPNFPIPGSWDTHGNPVLVAKTDSNRLQKVHHDTLEPEKLFDYSAYDERLKGRLSASHHQHDDRTNEVFNISMEVGMRPCLTVFKIDDKTGTATVLAEITHYLDDDNKTPFKPAYLHSFWLTQHYVIVPISPIYFKNNGLDLAVTGNLMSGMEYHADTPTLFYIVSREGGHVATVPVDPHFAFHTIHGHDYLDANGNIVLELNTQAFDGCEAVFQTADLTHLPRASEIDEVKALENIPRTKVNGFTVPPLNTFSQNSFGDLRQYKIVLDKHQPHKNPKADFITLIKNIEFARVHPAYQFKTYQYIYFNYMAPGIQNQKGSMFGLKKVDLKSGQETIWKPDTTDAYVCSEPVFIPRPGDALEEDDGVVLSLVNVYDNRGHHHDHCYMLILNAKDFTEYGRVPLGQFTAVTFHGSFVDHEFISTTYN
ncbi:carotenoid oxygenase [Halteromyces radiatus]|uniref:carotenoid oxygenase n=1 Tax=Halteromyces radiatus TaxID=101107 RepID=UPI00221F2D2B|nr:carotenoid oxygenase [Halteromyces radiatus]KAI8086787.1 carotenoid oxygenase [Halteromyces radiatus]